MPQYGDDGIRHVYASKGQAKMETFGEDSPPMSYVFVFLPNSLHQGVHYNKDGDGA